jgi:RNA polymerase sigma factor (sigma-70 family)
MKDEELALRVKEQKCNESLKKLITKHSPLCFNIYKRYSLALQRCSAGLCSSEIKNEKDYIIYNSCMSFKPEKNVKFSTWLGNYARYYCLNLINKNKNLINMEDSDIQFHIDRRTKDESNCFSSENPEHIKEYVLNILNQIKDERIEKVFRLRYFSGKPKATWSSVSKKLDISIQTAINLHQKGIKILRNKIKSKDLLDSI